MLALCLIFVPAAMAANPVSNPGFEDYCDPPGKPCSWDGGERDEINPRAGSASLRTFVDELTVIDRAFSDCAPASIASGPRTFSLWYRTGDTRISSVYGFVYFFSDTACASGSGFAYIEQGATANGTWQPASTSVQVPANVQSVSFTLGAGGGVNPGDPPAPINFDDVSLGSPTAVTITSFTAVRRRGGVHLRWRSASEVGVIGYEVLRAGPRGTTRIAPGLLRALRGAGTYAVVDRTARAGMAYRYLLRSVGLDGTRRTLRTVRLGPSPSRPA